MTLLAVLAASVPSHAANAGLRLGFADSAVDRLALTDALAAMGNARTAQASVWRSYVPWSVIAPTKPPSLAVAADPGWTGYRWDTYDERFRRIAAAGLEPLVGVNSAPAWAEGPGRPPVSNENRPGTWKPSPAWFGAFARAIAKRYSGSYPDPLRPGKSLPAVTKWQAWNEPNLSVELNPQWTRTKSGYTPASPAIYRNLLNAFYAGVKAVAPRDTIATAGTAPFGGLEAGDPRMPPVRFWRSLLCVSAGAKPKPTGCGKQVRFDAIAHHPYPIGPPRRHARNADDVVVPDLGKITRLVAVASKAGTIAPKGAKPLWVTEISWDSKPDPDGLSLASQARYLEGALYVLWTQGVRLVTWWNVRDDLPKPSYAATYQSGIFTAGPTPAQDVRKPSYTAFTFPFTAYRYDGVARLWGMAPAAGAVTIQAKQGSRWVTATKLRAGANRVFSGTLRVGQGVELRAASASRTSLSWVTL